MIRNALSLRLAGMGLVVLAFASNPRAAHAWAEHNLVTRAALSAVPELNDRTVAPTDFSELLTKLGIRSPQEFNESIQIRKTYAFAPRLGETAGKPVPVLDVLCKYADEPDWGMDIELFEPGQYPELWKDEYSMMGGRKGTPSQAFRHMYWHPFLLLHPLKTFKLPIQKLFAPMGEAPRRAMLFLELAHRAQAVGERYWSIRFVANALHYLEDVASLFHSTQTPSKRFILMPLIDPKLGSGLTDFVPQVTHIVSYYHFAFEDYVGYLMKRYYESGDKNPEARSFVEALAAPVQGARSLPYVPGKADELVIAMAYESMVRSSAAANASIGFFPELTVRFAELDPERYLDDRWWKQTVASGKADSADKLRYFTLVREIFSPLGTAVRDVVSDEVLKQPGR